MTYAAEREERGFPLWHPLPFQFPDDPEGGATPTNSCSATRC